MSQLTVLSSRRNIGGVWKTIGEETRASPKPKARHTGVWGQSHNPGRVRLGEVELPVTLAGEVASGNYPLYPIQGVRYRGFDTGPIQGVYLMRPHLREL